MPWKSLTGLVVGSHDKFVGKEEKNYIEKRNTILLWVVCAFIELKEKGLCRNTWGKPLRENRSGHDLDIWFAHEPSE